MIQGKGYILNLTLDNGLTKNIKLIDKTNVYNNRLQVINQYEEEGGTYKNRYDVTILVNGLPMVHVELKRRGIDIKEAFNQINRYLRDSFWAGRAMFDFVQIPNTTATPPAMLRSARLITGSVNIKQMAIPLSLQAIGLIRRIRC